MEGMVVILEVAAAMEEIADPEVEEKEVTGRIVCGVRLVMGAMEEMPIRSDRIDADRDASLF
jgi:hypothetical protein